MLLQHPYALHAGGEGCAFGCGRRCPELPASAVCLRLLVQVALGGLRPIFPPHTPLEYSQLAQRCWQAKPQDR